MAGAIRDVRIALKAATTSAFVMGLTILAMSVLRALLNRSLYGKWSVEWRLALVFSVGFGALLSAWTFASTYLTLRAAGPADAILDRAPLLSIEAKQPLKGFIGMEYYAIFLNRTYVVFATRDGLYGWKVAGLVSAASPRFFEPYQRMLEDPELMRDRGAVEELGKLKGGFFISASEISSVEASDKSKWGMGGIPHSGRISVGMTSGKSREFILLGSVSPDAIRDTVFESSARFAVLSRS